MTLRELFEQQLDLFIKEVIDTYKTEATFIYLNSEKDKFLQLLHQAIQEEDRVKIIKYTGQLKIIRKELVRMKYFKK